MSSTEEATPPLNGTASSNDGVDTEATQSLSDSNTSIDLIASRSPSPSLLPLPRDIQSLPDSNTSVDLIANPSPSPSLLVNIPTTSTETPQILNLVANRSPSPASLAIIPTTNTEPLQTFTGISRKRKANGALLFNLFSIINFM